MTRTSGTKKGQDHYRLAKVAAKVAYLAAPPKLAGLAPAPSTVEVV